MNYLIAYYLISLIACWIRIGWEQQTNSAPDTDKAIGTAFWAVLFCWLAVPMLLFIELGTELKKRFKGE